MEYGNANIYNHTPVIQNSIPFSPVDPVNPVKIISFDMI